ncbi:MAG: N-acetylglutaminylglutamine synthetase [Actinomycetota bacterium]|nr:N-acetylglutaminylglutamine synthetase [Actinomycetota bacterium]
MTDDRPQICNVSLECGWGRLVFGQTFADDHALAAVLRAEELGQRDVCLYHPEPHVLVSRAPHELFVDPSYTFRRSLVLDDADAGGGGETGRGDGSGGFLTRPAPGVVIRPLAGAADADAVNRLYAQAGMVMAPSEVLVANQDDERFCYLVAEDTSSSAVVGTVTGVDHAQAWGDPEAGASLWCLTVDQHSSRPGLGAALVNALGQELAARGCRHLDLSVLHDNAPAIALYEKLGFQRVPVFCVKRKNPINEPLFSGPLSDDHQALNPYARIVADEARRRGIGVTVIDAEGGFLRLSHGGRHIVTRESLSELTSGVAVSWCDDKRITRRLVAAAGLAVPRGRSASTAEADRAFLAEVGELVVKPARGEQGVGITVGVTDAEGLAEAVERARALCPDVLLEQRCDGDDLRVVVIGHEVVAAAVRRPATVVGDGRHGVGDLIAAQSRRRAAATGGESTIPVDETTLDTLRVEGRSLDDVLGDGEALAVRRTGNLHTGGTIHDVTARLHPTLAEAAVRASRVLDLPVTGLDFLVRDVEGPDYVFIEANERPGLANHEPQPTAQRFIDLLFPATRGLPRGWKPATPSTSR